MRQICIQVPEERCYDVVDCLQMECGLRSITKNTEDGIVQLSCLVDDHSSGYVMYQLDKIGCGVAYGKIVLIPVSVVKPLPRGNAPVVSKANTWYKQLASAKALSGPLGSLLPTHERQTEQQELRNKFSRLAVEEIYSVVDGGCSMTADYFSYILVGSMIAAVGLTTNNAVMIVASMLVSPLMGPILGFTYGTAIWDLSLIRRGVLAEMAGVGVTALIGFLAGLIISGWRDVPDKYDWPTPEMASRGDKASLLVGIFFAIPSGVGVALSATQGGVNSLVGVAIAASLLPPVVNVGLCLAFALVGSDGRNDAQTYFDISGLSLCLFLMNIAIIYVVCMFVFRIKKITPVRRQLSRYQELPLIKAINPDAAGPDGIVPEAVGPPRVVVATPIGRVPTANGSPSVPGTMIELRTVPHFVAQKLMDEHPNPNTEVAKQQEKQELSAADAVCAASERLAALAQNGHPLACAHTHGDPHSNSSSSSSSGMTSEEADAESASGLRLLEHVQGQPKGGAVAQGPSCGTAHAVDLLEGSLTGHQHHAAHAGHAVHAACVAPARGVHLHDGTQPLHDVTRDVHDNELQVANPLAASNFGLPLPPDVAVPALLEDPFEALGGGAYDKGLQEQQQIVGGGACQEGEQQEVQLQQQEQMQERLHQQQQRQASTPQQQQQKQASIPQQQQQQQRFLPFNEWTLDDSTLEEWAAEVVRTPESVTASMPGTRSTSGQLVLREEQEGQLRARWRRLVESHFGVRLEDVQECDEEGKEDTDSSGKHHKPVFEKKFQSFLKKLNVKLPRSPSSSSSSSYARSSLSSKATSAPDNPNKPNPNNPVPGSPSPALSSSLPSAGIKLTASASAEPSQQKHMHAPGAGIAEGSAPANSEQQMAPTHSLGSSTDGAQLSSSSSAGGVGAGGVAFPQAGGRSYSGGVGAGGVAVPQAARGFYSGGVGDAGAGSGATPQGAGGDNAAAAAGMERQSAGSANGRADEQLSEGRVMRNSTEAWALVRKAVVSMHHQRQPEGGSSGNSKRSSASSNVDTGKKGA